jgi:hypothetical protein
MWTLKEEYNGQTKQEIAEDLKMQLLNLKSKISEIQSIEVGINSINHEKNHDVILISEFHTFDDLKKYSTHPEHIKVVDFVKNISTGRAAVDFTMD